MPKATVADTSLHVKLQRLAVAAGDSHLTMADGLRHLAMSSNGYGIPLLLLSLPGALPMPALGLSSLLGVVVVLLGVQIFIGKTTVWLPQKFSRIRIRPDWSLRAARMGERFLPKLERLVKPRLNWMRYRLGTLALGLAVFMLGVLMVIPVPGTNTPPALVLLTLSIGLMENDGVMTLIAALAAFLLTLLYAEAFYHLINWLVS